MRRWGFGAEWEAGGAAVIPRVTLAGTEGLGFSAHSFLHQAVAPGDFGNLGTYWTGAQHMNYAGFSSLKQRWDANGVDRTASYDGALLLTEIGDLVTGLADPASAQGIETLQHLYWYALTAQAKGCRLLGIYIPHSPEGANIDADALAKVQYWLNWLRGQPAITIPVYAIPVPVIVRAMIDRYAPASVYADGLHLRTPSYPAPNQMNNAMGQAVRMFLTGQRPANDPGWNADLIALVDDAWSILQAYQMTGLGGATVVAPFPVASDPLPNPTIPPEWSAIYIDRNDAPPGNVSSLTARGTWAQAFSNVTGSGSINVMQADGLQLNGNTLRANMTRGPFSRMKIMADVTRAAAPLASNGVICSINPNGVTGVRFWLRYTSSNYQLVGPSGTIMNLAPIGGYGDRQVIGGELDLVAGTMTGIDADGETQVSAQPTGPISVTRVDIGTSSVGKLHSLVVTMDT